jgi:Fe-S oxidoreductase/nitrate reductase gamma subunit
MYALTLIALVVFGWGFLLRVKVYRQGQPLNRLGSPGERFVKLLKDVFMQSRVLMVRGPGVAHGLLFWGFCLLFIGTCLVVLQADIIKPFFGIKFLKGNFYLIFSIILDFAGLVAIIMLCGLFVRRYLVRPEGLETSKDDAVMYGLLFAILITGFLIEGARMAVTEMGTTLTGWSPVGMVFAWALEGLGEASLLDLHVTLWWLHMVLVVVFIMLIPFTKFRHIFTTSINSFFADLGQKGRLVTLNFENEGIESFGVSKVSEFTWKDIFDSDACTSCKRCQDHCPAHATDKPLSPMKVINQIREVAFRKGEGDLFASVSKDALWACTTCRACQEICPASIEHISKIIDMRRNMLLMQGEFPGAEVMTAVENTEVNGNPFGIGFALRGDWAEAIGIKTLSEDKNVDILYFVGCYASFDKRNIKVASSFVKLCQAAGIKVGILGKEEKCCGDPVRKMGNEYLYQTLATENIEMIKKYDVKMIVTACPHCFNTLGKDYRDLGLDLPVEHYTVFLNRLVTNGSLRFNAQEFDCTYHDSCYLGRYNDIYEQPRTLLNAAGGKITEIEKNHGESFCCGAGGGRILAEENLGERINRMRVSMAASTGANIMVSSCPFCLSMFEDGIKGIEKEGSLTAKDITEILAEKIVNDTN